MSDSDHRTLQENADHRGAPAPPAPTASCSRDPVARARTDAFAARSIDSPLDVLTEEELQSPINVDPPADGSPFFTPDPPPTLQGYRDLREVSSGGQATVFRAIQESTGRLVALKVLPGGPFAHRRARARFEREARILATIDHPNVVRIIDRFRSSEGAFVFVMDYVEGTSLDGFLVPLPARDAAKTVVALFIEIADAVAAAHRRGIVHRDLKPSNILVDAYARPRVVDFGLACTKSPGDRARVTATGQMVGSIPWASPEQVSGSEEDVDARTDIYSLGMMLYYGLTGRSAYPTSGSLPEIFDAILRCQPQPPHLLPDAQIRGVDAALSVIVMKALAKNRDDRFVTARELASDLRRWLAGLTPVAAYATPRTTFPRKRALAVAVPIVGLAVAFLARTMYTTARSVTPPTEPTPVKLPHTSNSIGMTFIQLPAGTFTMGSPAEEPGRTDDERQRRVTLARPLWFSATEVTRAQYRSVMGTLPDLAAAGLADDYPVNGLSATEATEFCRRLSAREHRSYRLPSEAEWEWACRASDVARPWSGNGNPADMGWCSESSGGSLHAVAKRRANAYGLWDMHGNVAEWCWSAADAPTSRSTTAAVAAILRGGSASDPAIACRSASRKVVQNGPSLTLAGLRPVVDADDFPAVPALTQENPKTR